jgi:hypothetical protein
MKRSKAPKPVTTDQEDLAEELGDIDEDGPDEGPRIAKTVLVSKFIRMRPRAIFDTPVDDGSKTSIASSIPEFEKSGV